MPLNASPSFNTRIPPAILRSVVSTSELPAYLTKALDGIIKEYKPLSRRRGNNDAAERRVLVKFGDKMLRRMGFTSATLEAVSALHSLELAGWGGRQDHFFHSFQNYLFGLLAVGGLRAAFEDSQNASNLHWSVDPCAVWMLTALYHDVGYGIQALPSIFRGAMGFEDSEGKAESARADFLREVPCQVALRQIASLMAWLLDSTVASTGWMPPMPNTKRTVKENAMEQALKDNFMESHGAAGAIRLYSDLGSAIDRMTNGPKRNLLRQTMLLACVSIPFHDFKFRRAVRNRCERCSIPVEVMPYAATLCFIDSIQDDRRNLEHVTDRLRFLEKLIVERPATVKAKVNRPAKAEDTLWKIVEACDVLGHLVQSPSVLNFKYPLWMAG
jgi:hypothetical protein